MSARLDDARHFARAAVIMIVGSTLVGYARRLHAWR